MDTNVKHRIWIKSIGDNTYSLVITYCKSTTKETIIQGLEAVKERVIAFKLLYDGDFEVISDVNFT